MSSTPVRLSAFRGLGFQRAPEAPGAFLLFVLRRQVQTAAVRSPAECSTAGVLQRRHPAAKPTGSWFVGQAGSARRAERNRCGHTSAANRG